MRPMSLSEVSAVTQGAMIGADVVFSAVSTDSRSLQPGELFVALKGANFDGNQLVGAAEQAGAVAAVVSTDADCPLPLVRVRDTASALGNIAAFNRRLSSATVIAVTGSQGKTTVKEMLAAILALKGKTLVTTANLNNTLGVPLTLLQIEPAHRFAVIEMGANMPGEIACSAGFAQPDIVHITNVAATHLEGFGSLDGVNRAKSEIWHELHEGGTAVINLDDDFAGDWLKINAQHHVVTISAKGNSKADYRLVNVDMVPGGSSKARLASPQGEFEITMSLPGHHNLANALAAAAMALEAGAGIVEVQNGLTGMVPVKGRMQTLAGLNDAIIIDDSYNASPSSFHAAIDVLAAMAGRSVLVMGDMGELGSLRETAHREVGNYARNLGIDHLFAVGAMSVLAVEAFGQGGRHFPTQEALITDLLAMLAPATNVLVKGSRSAHMDKLIAPLTQGAC